MQSSLITVAVKVSRIRSILIGILTLVIGLGLWVEMDDLFGGHETRRPWLKFLSLSWEQNLPTWVSTLTLFSCAILLFLNGLRSRQLSQRWTTHWFALGGIFTYISLDEFTAIHENANDWFDFGGVLYYGWVIPAFCCVVVIGLSYIGFLRDLPPMIRYRFMLAASLYIGGALIVEMALGYWSDLEGIHNVEYSLIDLLQESMELAGASLFLVSLLRCLAGGDGAIQFLLPLSAPSPMTSVDAMSEGTSNSTVTS